jgi:hypothetical protein
MWAGPLIYQASNFRWPGGGVENKALFSKVCHWQLKITGGLLLTVENKIIFLIHSKKKSAAFLNAVENGSVFCSGHFDIRHLPSHLETLLYIKNRNGNGLGRAITCR